jgi:helicase
MRVPDADCPPTLSNALNTLAERLRFGVPSEVIDLLKAGSKYLVPGFGRHRAMVLREAGLSSPNDVLKADRKTLAKLLENETRAGALCDALVKYFDAPLAILKVIHANKAKDINFDPALVRASYDAVGHEYEIAVEMLLDYVKEWTVTRTDKGKRQAYPDFMIEFRGKVILVECKTKQKDTATLSKEEAFAVLSKSTDFKKDHCLTIGKPGFDDTSKSKADGSREVTLMRHHDLVESLLRYSAGKVSGEQLFTWLMIPGHARLEQLLALTIAPGN